MGLSPNPVAISLFAAVIALTLAITYWAGRRSKTTTDLYAAGGRITAGQNGLAIVGDLLSAAMFLGGIGTFFASGYDVITYFTSTLVGFAIMLALITGPLRRLGRFTFTDAVTTRLNPRPIRIFAAVVTLVISLMYLIVQMVGAGGLIEILFGIPYTTAVILVGGLMIVYVSVGGMLATTWLQITKACLLIGGMTIMTVLSLAQTGFNLNELYVQAANSHRLGENLFQPGGMNMSPAVTVSLAMALCFGIMGMPHILIRFFTVPNPVVARRSIVVAMTLLFLVYVMLFVVLGAAGVAFVSGNPEYVNANGMPRGGVNMVALHLAAHVGGDVLFGIIGAVVFSTILAVVAGLTIAASAALSHDLYAGVFAQGKTTDRGETIIFRSSCLVIGAVSILLGIAFQGQNIIYLTGMLFSVAASACFPILLMSIYWRRLTTIGAITGGSVGLVLAVGIIMLGPSVWVSVLGNPTPILPFDQPAIISMPAAFLVMIVVSLLTQEAERPVPAGTTGAE